MASRVRAPYTTGRSRPGGCASRVDSPRLCDTGLQCARCRRGEASIAIGAGPSVGSVLAEDYKMTDIASSRVVLALIVLGVVVALATTIATIGPPTSVSAQLNCGTDTDCPDIGRDPDPDVTSLLHVTHREDALYNPRWVEPNIGESWLVTAKYASADSGVDCKCVTEEYTATVDVDWDGVAETFWISAESGTSTYPFNTGARLCTDDTCTDTSGAVDVQRGYGYELAIDLDHTVCQASPVSTHHRRPYLPTPGGAW